MIKDGQIPFDNKITVSCWNAHAGPCMPHTKHHKSSHMHARGMTILSEVNNRHKFCNLSVYTVHAFCVHHILNFLQLI